MKTVLIFFCFIVFGQNVFAQSLDIDTIVQQIADEKDENKKADLILSFYTKGIGDYPDLLIEAGQKLLKQSQNTENAIVEASALSLLGQGYRLSGNYIKGLEYNNKAVALAEESGNESIIAMALNQLGHIYKDREETDKAIEIYKSAFEHAQKGDNKYALIWIQSNLAAVYLIKDELDSALIFAQRSYELNLQINLQHNYKIWMSYNLTTLGGIHSKMGNTTLAVGYYNMAINEVLDKGITRLLCLAYTGLAQHYKSVNQMDSSIYYATKAIFTVANSEFFYLSNKPAKLLSDIYEKKNCDSALKYVKIFQTANDSLYNKKTNQQIQLMTFEENIRQMKLSNEKSEAEHQRKQNIQYVLIALGIITFVIFYLILSRSFITNTKLIEFLGVLALLIVFEFINLLFHPLLQTITNHTPALMLFALVCIASLLIPLHHRLEKWTTSKLVEKNKAIRLANAKKTLEQLGEKTDNL